MTAGRPAHVASAHDAVYLAGGCVEMIADAEVAAWDTLQNHVNTPFVLLMRARSANYRSHVLTSGNVDLLYTCIVYELALIQSGIRSY